MGEPNVPSDNEKENLQSDITDLQSVADALFHYLKNVIYDYENAFLDIEKLPPQFQTFGKVLVFYCKMVNDVKALAYELASGNLNCELPPSGNEIAAPLKSLHASLKHLTWQSQQAAQGDYNQRVDFMGDFSRAFNSMVEQFAKRQKNLETEVEKIYFDGLTGIYNRRYLDKVLDNLISSRSGDFLSFMMIDIDFFKKYNDTYGHNGGDECLKIVALTLKASLLRSSDFVARYGGEEFAVVMPNVDENGSRIIADRLLKAIRTLNIPHEKSEIASYVTISIGVTTSRVDRTLSGLDYIKRADEALYQAKKNGRNRYVYASLNEEA